MAYTRLETEMLGAITRMRLQGIRDREIYSRLSTQLSEGTGVFSSFRGMVNKGGKGLVSMAALNTVHSRFEGLDQKLIWQLDPTAQEHCTDCLMNEGMAARTHEEWMQIGLPGSGNTECGEYCKCLLVEASE
jgi:hypothetical protein